MGLKAIVSKIEEVPEAIRSLYKQDNGKIVLDVDAVEGWSLEDVNGLKTSLSTERELRRDFEKRAKESEGKLTVFSELGDPTKVKEDLSKFGELKKIDPKKEADRLTAERVDLWTKEEGGKYQATIKDKDTKIDGLTKFLTKVLIESEAIKAITASKGKVKPLLPHVLANTRLREVDGEYKVEVVQIKDGKEIPRIGGTDGSPMTINQFVEELKKDDDFAGNFEGRQASGGGLGGTPPPPGMRTTGDRMSNIEMIKAGLNQLASK